MGDTNNTGRMSATSAESSMKVKYEVAELVSGGTEARTIATIPEVRVAATSRKDFIELDFTPWEIRPTANDTRRS